MINHYFRPGKSTLATTLAELEMVGLIQGKSPILMIVDDMTERFDAAQLDREVIVPRQQLKYYERFNTGRVPKPGRKPR